MNEYIEVAIANIGKILDKVDCDKSRYIIIIIITSLTAVVVLCLDIFLNIFC